MLRARIGLAADPHADSDEMTDLRRTILYNSTDLKSGKKRKQAVRVLLSSNCERCV